MPRALYSGSFDPVTLGHLDIVSRAASVFDQLEVVVGSNPAKKYLFSLEERLSFLRGAIREPRVKVCSIESQLLADYAYEAGIPTIVKGIRGIQDYDYERMVRPESSVEPAGGRPAQVGAGTPGSRPQPIGREAGGRAGCQEPSFGEGASARAATSSEACRLDKSTTREPSRACHGEGDAHRAGARRATRGGSCRGMGRGTCTRFDGEQERPVCAALVRARRLV